ncbi:unnamed protein product [Triticum turgidum subsp. durum]|uniref:Uncharacterized protein n=1 Tax=Triticum turgidum subsp. durum TaxID=4567 RepID=A0A9R0ZR28_TRITD|nr:unnamed protein product [Triticum turgidum subsp. durum]
MARAFVRSISFPLSPSRSSSSSKPRAPSASHHERSVSLPCRSHPILAHLHTHIRAVRAWAQQGPAALAASVAVGLAHVDALHSALGDLLDLPEAQAALSGAGGSAESCSCKGTAALVCLVKKNKKKSSAPGCGEEGVAVAAVAERLEELEECIEELEAGSEKVFRSLVQTRVALLNIHTLHIF